MIKNIFLDRDGIINEIVMRADLVSSPRVISEFTFKNDFLNIVPKLNTFSGNIFIVSNQPDIARNLMDIDVLEHINIEISKVINPKEIVYCTCDGGNCGCRKPKPSMINQLIDKYNLKKNESVIVGDSVKDIESGINAGILSVFLETDYNKNQIVTPNYKIKSLNDFFQLNLF